MSRATVLSDWRAVGRLELAEVLRSRWLVVSIGLYGLVGGLFVLVGLRESEVVGFTGMGRVLFSLCHALLLLLPLVALAATGHAVNRARDEGALELILSQPIRRSTYLVTVGLVRFGSVALPLAVMFVLFGLAGRVIYGQAVPWTLLARTIALCTALVWAFTAVGLAISVRVRHPARAMTALVLAWATGVALLDFALIGMLLTWRVEPHAVFALAAVNPVQMVRVALLAAAGPELATLGPVGFWLASRVGPEALLALGIAWPLAFGGLLGAWALQSFRRGDAV